MRLFFHLPRVESSPVLCHDRLPVQARDHYRPPCSFDSIYTTPGAPLFGSVSFAGLYFYFHDSVQQPHLHSMNVPAYILRRCPRNVRSTARVTNPVCQSEACPSPPPCLPSSRMLEDKLLARELESANGNKRGTCSRLDIKKGAQRSAQSSDKRTSLPDIRTHTHICTYERILVESESPFFLNTAET